MFLFIHHSEYGFYSIFNLHSRFILYPIKSICNPIFQSSNNHIPQIKNPRRLMHPREIKINSIHPQPSSPSSPSTRIPIRSRTLSTSDFYLHPIAQLPWPTNTFSHTLHSFHSCVHVIQETLQISPNRRVVNNYRIVRENVSIERLVLASNTHR